MSINAPTGRNEEVTCPFCGLACDDLVVELDAGELRGLTNACPVASAAFAAAFEAASNPPRIRGEPVSMEHALDHAARLLGVARAPLFAGLETDVNGVRAALSLAERCGAVLDHSHGDALFRNLLVLQDRGWFTTTFTEVRNRADLILVVGAQCLERFPRLLERVLMPPEALFSPPADRKLVLVGPWDPSNLPASLRSLDPMIIQAPLNELAGVAGMLRALLAGRPVRGDAVAGVAEGALESLAAQLREAAYGVVTWSAAELDFPHAELTVQTLVELVRDLNQTTRAAALPLAGTLGDLTANQVCTWQTGVSLRSGLGERRPRYEPRLYRHQDVLARDEADLLLWISSLTPRGTPPSTEVPTILLSRFQVAEGHQPEVQIPVGVPGVDHTGHWYRGDSVCPLPLRRLREPAQPSVAEVLGALDARLVATAREDHAQC